MENYSVQQESQRILEEQLLKNEQLSLPREFAEAAKRVKITGRDPKPFIPTPCKITESAAALAALVAAEGSAISADRYGIGYQAAEVDT
ncbi:hypothetical protein VCV18_011632 [Metarhizium anisopliae]